MAINASLSPTLAPDAIQLQLQSCKLAMRSNSKLRTVWGLFCFLLCWMVPAWASVGGSISGTVKDPSGAAIQGATVALLNLNTGVRQSTTTGGGGTYSFPVLPVGSYALEVNSAGFKSYRRSGIALDLDSVISLDITLQVRERAEQVTVSQSAATLETNNSQLGEFIDSKQITAVPLNGRSYTDLLSLQP
ncbi:MAG: carboxypeptidase-like regulatory domain-containing protein, partial [Candidatus Sulfotelmatobacter sp.]